jgi:hypothetical protein
VSPVNGSEWLRKDVYPLAYTVYMRPQIDRSRTESQRVTVQRYRIQRNRREMDWHVGPSRRGLKARKRPHTRIYAERGSKSKKGKCENEYQYDCPVSAGARYGTWTYSGKSNLVTYGTTSVFERLRFSMLRLEASVNVQ